MDPPTVEDFLWWSGRRLCCWILSAHPGGWKATGCFVIRECFLGSRSAKQDGPSIPEVERLFGARCRRSLPRLARGGIRKRPRLVSVCFCGNPFRQFNARVFGKFKEVKAGLALRFAEPANFCTHFDSLSGFRWLDAQGYASLVDEGIDGLEGQTVFAQVKNDATVVGADIQIGE